MSPQVPRLCPPSTQHATGMTQIVVFHHRKCGACHCCSYMLNFLMPSAEVGTFLKGMGPLC